MSTARAYSLRLARINRERDYAAYTIFSLRRDPRLRHVLRHVLDESRNERRLEYAFFHGVVLSCTSARFNVALSTEDHNEGIDAGFDAALVGARRSSTSSTILIARDLQPAGVRYLGALYGIEPRFFEYFLDREACFESYSPNYLVFDYPESYQATNVFTIADGNRLLEQSPQGSKGNLVRLWRDVYGYFQRIAWAVVTNDETGHVTHVIICDSLPKTLENKAIHLDPRLISFNDYLRQGKPVQPAQEMDALAYIQARATELGNQTAPSRSQIDKDFAGAQMCQTVTDLIRFKWQVLLDRVQERISESNAPLSGDLGEIEEVIQRKHDFEKLHRTMSVLINSVQKIPGLARPSDAVKDLEKFQATIASWSTQLEKVSQSMLGMLAVSESVKATQQAKRTKNLQLLAFVFIPISTAASIYGINTVEINGAKPRTWTFVVLAISLTVVSALIALVSHTALPREWSFTGAPKTTGDKHVNDAGSSSPLPLSQANMSAPSTLRENAWTPPTWRDSSPTPSASPEILSGRSRLNDFRGEFGFELRRRVSGVASVAASLACTGM